MKVFYIAAAVLLSGCHSQKQSHSKVSDYDVVTKNDVMFAVETNAKIVFILDQYKLLSANYLEDNQSVSSIPANYKALGARHNQWLNDFIKHTKSTSPNWTAVTDLDSYEKVSRGIQVAVNKFPSDEALVASTGLFISDVVRIDETLAYEQKFLNDVKLSRIPPVLDDTVSNNYKTMRTQIQQTIDDMASYRRMLRSMKTSLTNLQYRRTWLKKEVPSAWQRILEYRLVRANTTVALDLIQKVNDAVAGELSAANIMASANLLVAKVRYNYEQFAPQLTKRALISGLSGIARLRQEVELERMSAETKKQLIVHLDTVQTQIEGFQGNASEMVLNRSDYVEERKRIAKSWLAQTDSRNHLCKKLAKNISLATETDVRLDYKFIQLRQDCM